jgi:methylenetetrahydrofolate reductase (NADPH)
LKPDGTAILAGVIPLKSGKMAHWLNENVPGIAVPRALLHEMDAASAQGGQLEAGIDIAGRIIEKLRPISAGVHLMALGWEQHLPRILQAGGILRAIL